MDFDVLDSLEYLGYNGMQEECDWKMTLEKGPKSVPFTQLVEWLSKELQDLLEMDSCVNAITDPNDSSSFLLEVSTFLKELQCPHKSLVTGPISQRLLDVQSRLALLDYLCTELQAARVHYQKTRKKVPLGKKDTIVTCHLNTMANILNAKATSDNNASLLTDIKEKIKDQLTSHPELLPKAATEEELSLEQWNDLEALYKDFQYEYCVRREMLLTRLDVTIQSFKWGEGSKGKGDQILNAYANKRNTLTKAPSVELSDLIASRDDILAIEKTSSDELVKNTRSSINRVLIKGVPDRGGRPDEQRPAKEMPKWSKRSGGGGGGRGDYRGGGNRQQKHFKGPKENKRKEDSKDKAPFDAAGTY